MSVVTTNMGLTRWTAVNDLFNHSELAANFAAIDTHSHMGGPSGGVQIPTAGLANLSVTSGKLASDSVTTTKVLDGNITTPKLAALSVTAAKVGVLPATRVYHNIGQTIPNATGATLTPLVFNTERYDSDTMHDMVANTGRITCKTTGFYALGIHLQWAVNSTGTRQVVLRLNGTTVIAADRQNAIAVDDVQQSLVTHYKLAVNDYIEVLVRQTSGTGLDVVNVNAYSPEFFATFLSN